MTDAPLIAILDDEPEIRRLLSAALEEAGFRTAAFARATEFEAALRRIQPDACLIDRSPGSVIRKRHPKAHLDEAGDQAALRMSCWSGSSLTFHGSSSSIRLIGCSAIRSRT